VEEVFAFGSGGNLAFGMECDRDIVTRGVEHAAGLGGWERVGYGSARDAIGPVDATGMLAVRESGKTRLECEKPGPGEENRDACPPDSKAADPRNNVEDSRK
jgi:hypothetical protein